MPVFKPAIQLSEANARISELEEMYASATQDRKAAEHALAIAESKLAGKSYALDKALGARDDARVEAMAFRLLILDGLQRG